MGLDAANLVLVIEEEFNVSFPDEVASKIVTVGDIYTFILKEKSIPVHEQDTAWVKLEEIVVAELGVPPDKVTKEASIVDDLGAD